MSRQRSPSNRPKAPHPRRESAWGPGLAWGDPAEPKANQVRSEHVKDFGGAECEGGSIAAASNRRALPRVGVDLEVSLGTDASHFTARCVNLSPGGLLISTFRRLEPGFVLSVEFDLPASRVVAEGVVRWSREATDLAMPGYGVAFTELTRFDRTLIESFCAELAPEAYRGFFERRLAG